MAGRDPYGRSQTELTYRRSRGKPTLETWVPASWDHFQVLYELPPAESTRCLRWVHTGMVGARGPGWAATASATTSNKNSDTVPGPEQGQCPGHGAKHLSRSNSRVTGPGRTLTASEQAGTGPRPPEATAHALVTVPPLLHPAARDGLLRHRWLRGWPGPPRRGCGGPGVV